MRPDIYLKPVRLLDDKAPGIGKGAVGTVVEVYAIVEFTEDDGKTTHLITLHPDSFELVERKRRPLMRIGQEFECPPGERWRVTDVGARTFLAVGVTHTLITHDGDATWLNGPPYAVVEHVFDETDYDALEDVEGIEWSELKVRRKTGDKAR